MFPHVSCLSLLVNVVLWADVRIPVADLSPYHSVREPTQDPAFNNCQMVYREPKRRRSAQGCPVLHHYPLAAGLQMPHGTQDKVSVQRVSYSLVPLAQAWRHPSGTPRSHRAPPHEV